MKLRRLEMLLEGVSDFETPHAALEQYMTPASLAARVVHHAFLAGDIQDLLVCDLGCGTGILGIGAALLGASRVDGYDGDLSALEICAHNAQKFSVDMHCELFMLDTSSPTTLPARYDTILMNPPFGAQNTHADRPFIDCALENADVVYGIFNAGSIGFLKSYTKERATIRDQFSARIPVKRRFFFHTQDIVEIPVEVIIFDTI
jgi:putative methylase